MKVEKLPVYIATVMVLANCTSDEPTPNKPTDHAPTTETTAHFEGKNLHIDNENGDVDGDQTETKIRVTNGQLQEIFNKTFTGNKVNEVLKNLPADVYVVETVTTANGKKAEDKDAVERTIAVTANAELTVNADNVKDAMPAGTEVAMLSNVTFTIDGETKTQAELEAAGYEVVLSEDSNQLKVENGKIVLAESLDRDGENNTDPSELANLVAKAKLEVKKDGKVYATQSFDINQPVVDTQDWAPLVAGKRLVDRQGEKVVAEHADGSTYMETKDVIVDYDNEKEASNNNTIQDFVDGKDEVFEGEMVDGYLLPKIKSGPNAGKYIAIGKAIETMLHAMSQGGNIIDGGVYGDASMYAEIATKNLGNLVGQLINETDAFDEYTYNGRVFLIPKEADKIAGLAIVKVYEDLGKGQNLRSSK